MSYLSLIHIFHDQSNDINRGVDRDNPEEQGAGDQGMMFGYATTETANYMPLPLDLSNALLFELAEIRKKEPELMPYLRPDAKSQVTVEYDEQNHPVRIDTIVLSTQHDEFIQPADSSYEAQRAADLKMQERITEDIRRYQMCIRDRDVCIIFNLCVGCPLRLCGLRREFSSA